MAKPVKFNVWLHVLKFVLFYFFTNTTNKTQTQRIKHNMLIIPDTKNKKQIGHARRKMDWYTVKT